MADDNHMTGSGGSGGQGQVGGDRHNQDADQAGAVPRQSGSGDQESGAGYGNNAGVQGEDIADTDEGQR